MAGSRRPGSENGTVLDVCPSKTPGTTGRNDQSDPTKLAFQGDTPGSTGICDATAPDSTVLFSSSVLLLQLTIPGILLFPDLKLSPVSNLPNGDAKRDPNADMLASDNAATFVASFEAMGFICPDQKVRAYQDGGCGKGNWTIGIGEMSGRDKDSVFASEDEAYTSFVDKVKGEYTQRVRRALKNAGVKRQLAQYEFDALVDLAYQKGNCQALAGLIAANKTLKETDFTSQTDGYADRRSAEYNLFSGTQVTVKGYAKFLRLDNTNGGYCPIKGKPGYKRVNSDKQITLTY